MGNNHQSFFENKQTNKQTKKQFRKIVLLVRSKGNSVEKVTSKVLADSDISHDEFTMVINEEQSYFR